MICPTANAEVIAAIRARARVPAILRASCIPAMVITMNVPPTNRAAIMIPDRPCTTEGSIRPSAIARLPAIQVPRCVMNRPTRAAKSVETTAAAPKTGHAHPKRRGSGTTSLAMTGKKVAGMM